MDGGMHADAVRREDEDRLMAVIVFLLLVVVVEFWWLVIAGLIVTVTVVLARRAIRQARREELALVGRADEQHRQVLDGDDRGLYGRFWPADPYPDEPDAAPLAGFAKQEPELEPGAGDHDRGMAARVTVNVR